jgi:hypothetical protein
MLRYMSKLAKLAAFVPVITKVDVLAGRAKEQRKKADQSNVDPEVGIEEFRKNLMGILREFHRKYMYL